MKVLFFGNDPRIKRIWGKDPVDNIPIRPRRGEIIKLRDDDGIHDYTVLQVMHEYIDMGGRQVLSHIAVRLTSRF